MQLRDLIEHKGHDVHVAGPSDSLREVVQRLERHNVGALVVVEDGSVKGIVSERDVVRQLAKDGPAALDRPVRDVMSAPVETCAPDTDLVAVMALMTDRRIRHVPVVDVDHMVGIVSIGDVVKSRLEQLERDRKELLEYVSAR